MSRAYFQRDTHRFTQDSSRKVHEKAESGASRNDRHRTISRTDRRDTRMMDFFEGVLRFHHFGSPSFEFIQPSNISVLWQCSVLGYPSLISFDFDLSPVGSSFVLKHRYRGVPCCRPWKVDDADYDDETPSIRRMLA